MARILVNPRIGVLVAPAQGTQPAMKDILGVYNMMVYDTVSKTYKPATKDDLPG